MKYLLPILFLFSCMQLIAQTSDSYGDNDGDGVRNSFDKCPNTLKGVNVDMHGCPKDTDGDGVADYLDKQLITPTECQPVDVNGIGECPDPDCCNRYTGTQCCTDLAGPFYIGYSSNSARVNKSELNKAEILSRKMSSSPNCKVIVWGQVSDLNNKLQHQAAWERVNKFIEVMSEKFGTDKGRFIFKYGLIGYPYLIKISIPGSGMEGPSKLPPPYPELSRYIKK